MTGIGISVPSNPPTAAPKPFISALAGGSPASKEETATIRGPMIGILPKMPFTAFRPALPRNLVANLPGTFLKPPFAMRPFDAVLDANESAPGLLII